MATTAAGLGGAEVVDDADVRVTVATAVICGALAVSAVVDTAATGVVDVWTVAVRAVGVGRVGGVGAGVGEAALAVGVEGDAKAADLPLSRGFGLKVFAAVGFSGFFAASVPPAVDVPLAVLGGLADDESVDGELFAPAELVPDFAG